MATTPLATNPVDTKEPEQTPLDKALLERGKRIFEIDSKNRYAEDSAWFQAALFYQLKQWITKRTNRWEMFKQDPKKPIPMPVSDYFSKTINANANSLGAKIPDMIAVPNDQSSTTRRAALTAENAFSEMDKESGMDILNPILSKHTVLWGLGCTKETVDTSESTGTVNLPNVSLQPQTVKLCPNCGYMAVGDEQAEPLGQDDHASALAGIGSDQQQNTCPDCGATMQTETLNDLLPGETEQFPTGKICTEVIPILEIYLPRNCRDANLAKRISHKYRKPKEEAEDKYPNAGPLPVEEKREISQFYVESLQGLVMGVAQTDNMVSFTEIWAEWSQLDKKTRDALEAEWGAEPSQVIGYEGMTRCDAAKKYGIYWIFVSNKVIVKSENPWDGRKCFNFFPWEKDPASPYPKGLAVPLIPKQKQLNRLDCLMELSEQTHGVGKLMAPIQQMQNFKPSGNPVDIYWYDQAEGKEQPKFILPEPYGPALPAKRAAIIQDFRELGYTQGVSQGDNPGGGVSSFRGIAYLGAKAEENIQTQRFLWEQGHQLRKELLLIMVRKIWDQPRKSRVAGFNGRFGMTELTSSALMGDFGIQVQKGSSRPKTREEKLTSLQIAAGAQLIDMQDAEVRDFVLNELGISEVDQTDHYNYEKFDRDLEVLKQGFIPREAPSQKWDIWVRGLGKYQLTEEFEDLDSGLQQAILYYFQYCSDKLSAVTNGVPPDPMALNRAFASAVSGGSGGDSALSGVPGQTVRPQQAELAAQNQGNAMTSRISPQTSPASPA
jgi:hypothetical protein